jgi:hypothetical protein
LVPGYGPELHPELDVFDDEELPGLEAIGRRSEDEGVFE